MSKDLDIESLGEEVPLLEGMRTTRSIRRLLPAPVPAALIRKVCEAGTFAPSGGNRQPWYFIAVTDAERRAFIAERYRAAFAVYIAPALRAAESPDYPEPQRKILNAALYLAEHFHETLHGREIDAFLGLPEDIPSAALLPIGWPKGRYGRPNRVSVDKRLSVDRFRRQHARVRAGRALSYGDARELAHRFSAARHT